MEVGIVACIGDHQALQPRGVAGPDIGKVVERGKASKRMLVQCWLFWGTAEAHRVSGLGSLFKKTNLFQLCSRSGSASESRPELQCVFYRVMLTVSRLYHLTSYFSLG